jgi:sulfur carrier protein ThiS
MSVLVQTQGGTVKSIEATTAAQAADVLGINLDNTVISVNGTKVNASAQLRDDDFVSFTTDKVTSG